MFFVVSIERENEPAIVRHIPYKTWATAVKLVVAISLTESVLLPVIVIEVVAESADCSVNFCEIPIIPITAKNVPSREMKRRVLPRHFHDEIEGSSGLAPELQSGARTNEFNPLHCVQDWRVMSFWKTELLVLERDAVLQHLHELAALRIQTAITEVDDWRLRLFADDDARCRGHYLSIVVTGECRELCRFHERRFLADIYPRPFHWRQRGIWNGLDIKWTSCNDDRLGLRGLANAR